MQITALASPQTRLQLYPADDHDEFSRINIPTKRKAERLFEVAKMVFNAGHKNKTAVYQMCANEMGVTFNAIYAPVNAFLKTRDWRHLIDRKLAGREYWIQQRNDVLPHDFLEFWKLCVENNRCVKTAYDYLMLRLRNWRAGDMTSAITGYLTPPKNAKGCNHPAGWSLKTLSRNKSNVIELDAARSGRTAMLKHAPHVLTTRKTGYPMQEVQADDMWYDHKSIYGTQIVRSLEFNFIDWYSLNIFPPVIRPRVKEDNTHKSLSERDFRLMAVNFFSTVGWSPRGTLARGEKGMAAFRNGLDKRLENYSNGLLKIAQPGMSGAPAMIGGYSELAKGNPNAKAVKEGRGKIIHNYLAALSGQTGSSRNPPAFETGREKETMDIIALQGATGISLKTSHLTFEQSCRLIYYVTDLINSKTDHDIEGWLEEGLIVQELLAAPDQDIWMPTELVDPEYVRSLATYDPARLRIRRMSPKEVITPHLERNIKLSLAGQADCIFEDTRRSVSVINGRLSFRDQDYGIGAFRYPAQYQTPQGFVKFLQPGEEVQLCVNPFNPEIGHIFDLRDRLLGHVKRDHAPVREDVDAIHREIGSKIKYAKELTLGAQVRHGLKRENQLTENAHRLEQLLEDEILTRHGLKAPAPADVDMSDEYAASDLSIPTPSIAGVDVSILL